MSRAGKIGDASLPELRCQSAFSFLRGASSPEELVEEAARLELSTVALVDRDGLSGAPRFFRAARAAGIRPIVGAELSMDDGSALALLVENRGGYRTLCRLLTEGKLRSPKGEARYRWSDVEQENSGLVCLAGGEEGPLARAAAIDATTATRRLDWLQGVFGDRLYVDLQRHLDPVEEGLNRALADLATARRLPLVTTGGVRHARRSDRALLDVFTCIREKTTLDAAGRRLTRNDERHLQSSRERAHRFAARPDILRATCDLAERCEFSLTDLGYRFPDYPLPTGQTPDALLRHLAFEGARGRWPATAERQRAERQLDHELAVIAKLELAGYFLIVWDIVEFCRREGILVQGRGSAANSAVCYALGITAVDAVGMELLFERFLSEERGEWPDIDLDLPSGERRERVIQYVYERYGPRGAAMTANVISYRAKSAVREVGKALGFRSNEIDAVSKSFRQHGFRDGLDGLRPQVGRSGLDLESPRVRMFVDLVERFEGLPRHLGQHSGGMVVAAGRLDEVVPLEPARMKDRVVIQWDKDDCADLGIIKVDLLGLGMMAVLEDTIPLVRSHDGVDLDLAQLPPDDPAVYAALQRADTIGVFQVESRAQMATLPRMKPERFYDLVVEVALIRPGPIVGQLVNPYLERRAGREAITYPHPSLEPILKRTLGVPLFQEQLLRMAMEVGGFSPGEAEELRRAMGFKRSAERMAPIEARLRAGMKARGITGEAQDDIVRGITSFALYGFPESHAASFALLAYASAYLKVHHPTAFLAAMLDNWPLGFYHPATLVKDAQRHGVRVRALDVTRSNGRSRIEADGALRLGMRLVKGLREEAGQRIEAARQERNFDSIGDFAKRTGLQRREIDVLAHVGALAPFGATRRQALWQVAALETDAQSLFAGRGPARPSGQLPEMNAVERTLADYETSGVTVGAQLLAHLRPQLDARGVLSSRRLRQVANGAEVVVAGMVIVRQRPQTAKGFLFLTLEDEEGTTNAIVTPQLFERHRETLHSAPLLLVRGKVQLVDNVLHIRARNFEALRAEGATPPSHDFH